MKADPSDPKGHTVVNPRLVVEVLRPSTEEYDRGEKLAAYKQVDSLREIVLFAHDAHRLEIWHREDGGVWTLEVAHGDARARLPALRCELALGDIYADPLRR